MFCYLVSGDRSAALAQYEKCMQGLERELSVAPSAETRKLYEQIRSAPSESGAARITNLPLPLTSFIGREKESRDIKELMRHTRLLSLTGVGGCGKTRLALQVAGELLDQFRDGVWYVELAPLADAVLVPQTVANALGLGQVPGRAILEGLKYSLQQKQLLLVLDNCEHLIDACAQLADALLHEAPGLRILATSREALGITGETTFSVPSLTMPAPSETALEIVTESEAVRLFIDRASLVQPNFAVTDSNVSAVAQICVRLDGIPLALEFAAARVKGLSVQEIASHLDNRFRLLIGGSRTALPRHRTLHETMDWSYRLLSDPERLLLQRSSVFIGSWTLAATESVCADEGLERAEILDVLLHLVDKSLVVAETGGAETRYHMLETIRQYAQEKLDETSQSASLRDRHLDFFGALVAQLEPQVRSAAQQSALAQLDAEYDNVRAAIRWSQTSDVRQGMRMGWQLRMYWRLRGLFNEAEQQLLSLLTDPSAQEPTIERALALNALPMTFPTLLRYEPFIRYQPLIEEARTLSQTLGDPFIIALALSGGPALGDRLQDRPRLETSLAIFRTLKDQWHIAYILSRLGYLAGQANEHDAARSLLEEGLALARETEDRWLIAWTMNRFGHAATFRNAPSEARTLYQESLTIYRALGDQQDIAFILNNLGECARMEGEYHEALGYYAEAQRCYPQAFGFPYIIALVNHAFVALHLGDLALAETSAKRAIQSDPPEHESGLVFALTAMAAIAVKRLAFERAAGLMGYVENHDNTLSVIKYPPDARDYADTLAAIHAALDQETFERAWTHGTCLTREEVIVLALKED